MMAVTAPYAAMVIDARTGDPTALMYLAFYSREMSLSQISDYLLRVVQPQIQALAIEQAALRGARHPGASGEVPRPPDPPRWGGPEVGGARPGGASLHRGRRAGGLRHADPGHGLTMAHVGFYFERCVNCGCLYDPWIRYRVEIEEANIERLKAVVQHPLERLAECAKET